MLAPPHLSVVCVRSSDSKIVAAFTARFAVTTSGVRVVRVDLITSAVPGLGTALWDPLKRFASGPHGGFIVAETVKTKKERSSGSGSSTTRRATPNGSSSKCARPPLSLAPAALAHPEPPTTSQVRSRQEAPDRDCRLGASSCCRRRRGALTMKEQAPEIRVAELQRMIDQHDDGEEKNGLEADREVPRDAEAAAELSRRRPDPMRG